MPIQFDNFQIMKKDTPNSTQYPINKDDDTGPTLFDNIIRDLYQKQLESTLKNFVQAERIYDEIVSAGKQKIDQEFHDRRKQIEMKQKIHRSSLINKSHMRKSQLRFKMCQQVFTAVLQKIQQFIENNQDEYCIILIKFTVEGALRMFEPELHIRCLPKHAKIVERILQSAQFTFNCVMEQETGRNYPIKLKVNPLNSLKQRNLNVKAGQQVFSKKSEDQYCIGGVILADPTGNITYKNTIDARVNILRQICLPMMRVLLWPNFKQSIQNGKLV